MNQPDLNEHSKNSGHEYFYTLRRHRLKGLKALFCDIFSVSHSKTGSKKSTHTAFSQRLCVWLHT